MAMDELGPTIDLHGGGTDLIFPHHECEVAQSESITGEPFSRHWMHSAMVSYEGEKMSKSLGNLVFVSDLLKMADPARSASRSCATTTAPASSGTTPTSTRAPRCCTACSRPPSARRRRPAPFAAARARRHRRRPRRAAALEALDDLASAMLSGGDDADRARGAARARRAARHRPRRRPRSSPAKRLRPARAPLVSSAPHDRHHDHAARRFDARVRPRASPPATSRRRSARAWPRPRWRRRSTASGATSTARSTTTPRVAIVTPDSDDGREVLRHSTAHVMAQAVTDLFPGAKYAIGPAIEDGFYYDFELPDGAHFTDDDLERIEARMREIVKADEPFVREELDRDARASRTFADQPYKLEIIERVDPDDAGEVGDGHGHLACTATRSRRRRREFVDLCRGPHVPSTEAARRVQAHEGRRRVLARRREAPDAPAHLRHRVGVEGRARGAPAPARGGREARPPQARRRARPLLVPRRDRLRARGLPPEGRRSSAG